MLKVEDRDVIAIWADKDGLIPIPYFSNGMSLSHLVNPYTFAKNFKLSKYGVVEDRNIAGWKFDVMKTDDVFRYSSDEAGLPSKCFRLRIDLGMDMGSPHDEEFGGERIGCYRNREPPEFQSVEIGRYGYIFRVESRILTDIKGMGIESGLVEG
jgi:hypothetical protein